MLKAPSPMTNERQINDADSAVNRLSNELEHAEFIDADPVLQPSRQHTGEWHHHPAVSAYRAALKAARRYPDLTKNLHRQRRELATRYEHCKAHSQSLDARRVNDLYQPGLRRLVDADLARDFALEDLRAIEAQIAKNNRAKRKVKWKERMKPEFVSIGGELYPVSK